jgi:hypothetical protein
MGQQHVEIAPHVPMGGIKAPVSVWSSERKGWRRTPTSKSPTRHLADWYHRLSARRGVPNALNEPFNGRRD